MNIVYADCDFILRNAPVDWRKLKNSRLLLTGGTGYYGKWLLKSFLHINTALNLNAQIYIVSRSPDIFQTKYPEFAGHKSTVFINGDVRNFECPCGHFDYVIHAATEVATRQEKDNPNEMIAVAEDGTKHVLAFAQTSGVKKLLFTSSGAVYGTQPTELDNMPETFHGFPCTVYGKAKKISENLCLQSDVNCSIARCYASVGPWLRLDIQYAIGNFIKDAMNADTITIKSDGRPYRSYLYIADIVTWLWTILLKGKPHEAYNVGSEEAISIAELAKTVSKCVSPAAAYEILGTPDMSIPAPRYVPGTTKAQSELGLRQHYFLTDGIKRTIEWHRQLA